MEAFEEIVSLVARNKGYWTTMSLKVELTADEKLSSGLSCSCPRWEFDVVGYSPKRNEILAIECKSFLDSKGVRAKNGKLQKEQTYKLFNDQKKRDIVLAALRNHLATKGMCRIDASTRLVLAAGKIHADSRIALAAMAEAGDWELWTDHHIAEEMISAAGGGYENNVATMTAKIVTRYLRRDRFVSNGDDIEIMAEKKKEDAVHL